MKKTGIRMIGIFVFFCLLVTPAAAQESASPLLVIGLNLLPGFGLGSFLQGNEPGGWIQLGGECGGVLVFLYGLVYGSDLEFSFDGDGNSGGTKLTCIVIGIAVYGAAKIFGIIAPIIFHSERGETTKTDAAAPAVSVRPGLIPAGGTNFHPGVSLTVDF